MFASGRLLVGRNPSHGQRKRSLDISMNASNTKKLVWIQTTEKEVVTTSLESGISTFLVHAESSQQSNWEQWKKLGQMDLLIQMPDGSVVDDSGDRVGAFHRLTSAADFPAVEAAAHQPEYLITDSTDWQIIPSENLVAAFQSKPGILLVTSSDASSSRVFLEALEVGTDGVVLRTDQPAEVRALVQYLSARESSRKECFKYEIASVRHVKTVGMGDRACVDLAERLFPGEGMLVGNFARGLFLIHSECEESSYINSRPFRVNAGPVHAYIQADTEKTRYLSEIKSGDEVMVVDPAGRHRSALVGRVKIEKRPLIHIEAVDSAGSAHSILLQNAETVKIVGPGREYSDDKLASWRTIPVSEIKEGDEVFLLVQGGARHTGISIEEMIIEK